SELHRHALASGVGHLENARLGPGIELQAQGRQRERTSVDVRGLERRSHGEQGARQYQTEGQSSARWSLGQGRLRSSDLRAHLTLQERGRTRKRRSAGLTGAPLSVDQ